MYFLSQSGFWPWLFTKDDSDFPIFLRLGNFEIRWYAILILTGALLCLFRCNHIAKKRGMGDNYYDTVFILAMLAAIVGARLWYVIADSANHDWTFLEAIGFSNGRFQFSGLAIQGGVIFGAAAGIAYIMIKKKRYPIALHCDIAIPSIFIGQIIGRWGNFFNGEVYGREVARSSLWYVPRFIIDNCTLADSTIGSQAGYSNVYAPLFYIEGLLNLAGYILIGVILWRYWKWHRKPFNIAALYFIYYGVVRIIMEPLRDPSFIMNMNVFGHEINTSIFMSAAFILFGVIVIIVTQIVYRGMPFEKIYIKEAEEAKISLMEQEEQEQLQRDIAMKKAEIRARNANVSLEEYLSEHPIEITHEEIKQEEVSNETKPTNKPKPSTRRIITKK